MKYLKYSLLLLVFICFGCELNNTPTSKVDELFNIKGLSTSNYWYDEENGEISQTIPYQVSNKIKDIYSIYDAIMKELQYYDIDPDFKINK